MLNLKVVYALLVARNKEFYRDRGSMTWAIIFPLLVITAITFAFQDEDQELFRIGVLGNDTTGIEQLAIGQKPWITAITYADETKAQEKIRHHQLDLLIKPGSPLQYWVNPTSNRGEVMERSSSFTKEATLQEGFLVCLDRFWIVTATNSGL